LADNPTPLELGYRFPAEYEAHLATWLSWPHKEESWPGKIDRIYQPYSQFIKELSEVEKVRINIADEAMQQFAQAHIVAAGANMQNIEFFYHPTNDAWCRDHGPAFIINKDIEKSKAVIDWDYNAWGNKYPPYDLDDIVPTRIAEYFQLPLFVPGIVMEGGSVEFNGEGSLLTSKACLLNPNRNPHLSQTQIEQYLKDYYCVQQILWVSDGIVGDDTDGHIDDTVRFVNANTVLTCVEENEDDENYAILQQNKKELEEMRLPNGKALKIIDLPMPNPVVYEGQRLPASYANFYIANGKVIVPIFQCEKDAKALEIIQNCFPERKVIGINSVDIIWGLGSFHCLSQQEPL